MCTLQLTLPKPFIFKLQRCSVVVHGTVYSRPVLPRNVNVNVNLDPLGHRYTTHHKCPRCAVGTHPVCWQRGRSAPRVAPVSVRCHFWQKWHL